MNKIIYNLVFNRKNKLNENGVALVQIEAYLQRKKRYFSTSVYLKPNQWDNKKRAIINHPNADALNRVLHAQIASIEKKELELWQQGQRISLEILKDVLASNTITSGSFCAFYQKEIETSSLKENTKHNHRSTLKLLQEYKQEVSFQELTFDFVSSFDHFLQSKGYHINTIGKHMKHLKRYINVAINKDYMNINNYAFRKYKIRSAESQHTYLSPEELRLLEQLQLNKRYTRLQKTLNAFLFCCYTGLRYSDFTSLSADNIVEIHQKTWLIYRSVKTQTEVRLPLYLLFEGKGLVILNRHRDDLNEFFLIRDNSNINKELLVIAKLAGIHKRFSFHTARHTNATLLIYSGVNITTVQKLLGHRSVRTTEVYTNIMDATIINDLKKSKIAR